MLNEKTVTEKISDYASGVVTNGLAGNFSRIVLYKVGRVCEFSIYASITATSTNNHIASVPAECYPLARFNLSCGRYSETSGAECYIGSDGKIILANTQTGDFKISGTWVTAS